MQCSQCQHDNRETAKFCEACGARHLNACLHCGHEVNHRAKFCEACGAPLMPGFAAPSSIPFQPHPVNSENRFHAALPVVMATLQRERRVTYRELRYAFGLDDGLLDDIRRTLQFKRLARDEEGEGLVWTGEAQMATPSIGAAQSPLASVEPAGRMAPVHALPGPLIPYPETQRQASGASIEALMPERLADEPMSVPEPSRRMPEAERRQLTVMFCDLVGSTDLAGRLDPEDWREVVRAYQGAAAEIIERYEGHIAQYLGDGLLIYFGYPLAHEDDAQRAVHTGLGIVEAMGTLNLRLKTDHGVELAVRIGIHTGPVVVGEMGGGGRYEHLALGEAPNIAARLEGLAAPNAVVISAATAQLVHRAFVLEELGDYDLKGVAQPMRLYAVVSACEGGGDDPQEMRSGGFDTLVGRDEEIGLLLKRWAQSKEGQGQVVLICGEAGLGKSSLVEGLRAHVRQEGMTRLTFRCSPYAPHSAMHPVIEHVQHALGWQREDAAVTKLEKLEQALQVTSLPMEETVPLLAALLALPLPEGRYPPLTLTPQHQRQRTQDMIVTWMLEKAERQPVLAVWEDIHWADPSTLDLLGLFMAQVPTVPILNVLVFRPEFVPPWPPQSHMTPITLNRLERGHIEALVRRLTGDKRLPREVEAHLITRTDGVPLYVEELTKMLLESGLLKEEDEQYVLSGVLSSASIPATLQDSLMARLDRLPEVREVAQLGSVLGREFDYEMLQALAVFDDSTLQAGLHQLVSHDLLYQRGRLPHATYLFRHVLIRDAAYQSLLRRTRQQYHQRIADTLQARFPDTVETRPEFVAYHFTEAGNPSQAATFWLLAGQRAVQRSAHAEGIAHLQQGIEEVTLLPETPERAQRELTFQTALAPALMVTKGYRSADAKEAYRRVRDLCTQLGETRELPSALAGLWLIHATLGDRQGTRQLADQLLSLGQRTQDPWALIMGHFTRGITLRSVGELSQARTHFEGLLAIYDAEKHHTLSTSTYGTDVGLLTMTLYGWMLWLLGYPDQGRYWSAQALSQAQTLSHPYSLARVLDRCTFERHCRRESRMVLEHAEAAIALATERGFTQILSNAPMMRGWALVMQGQGETGLDQIHQTLAANRAAGIRDQSSYYLSLLAEAYEVTGQVDEGLAALEEALRFMNQDRMRFHEAEVYRLKGELLLKSTGEASIAEMTPENCFQRALDVARRQEAKSWELRAATSLARLWQTQGKRQEAHDLLVPVYRWFTEGFETADLQEAKGLLEALAGQPV
ncbi:adenylate/guanylate cyclase domain-containing protein [Candidatus Entotheonella palauensis]|uniref:adenylate/guanylate cyclase domain-containing protein n=1 Tax=Candidatus Entotheonella palauensis TaxID=93172 RepID=UPI0015C4D7EC|nr:adenylate/guanylate cyclase domain-containing protein [Candidatus Entotheonella palauensis]